MQFIPKKTKYKKYFKGKNFNKIALSNALFTLKNGSIGLKSITSGRISFNQLKTLRNIITKKIKKKGLLITNIFTNIPITKKPIETRMGKGKGNIHSWIFKVNPGIIICEIIFKEEFSALCALKKIQYHLPIKTKIFYNI